MMAAVYARKSREQNGNSDETKSGTRQIEHARVYAGPTARVAIWLWCPLVTLCCSVQPREVTLRCDYGAGLLDVYSLNEKANSVRLMSVDPPRPGFLTVSDSSYHLEFPEDHPVAGYLLLRVDVNRFTSKAGREIGRERTVMYQGQTLNLHAKQDSGDCVQIKGVEF